MSLHFYNALVLREHRIEKGELWVSDGKIVSPQAHVEKSIDLEGKLIAPGFIDLQLNGAFGVDITSQPERINEVAARLGEFGVTAFLGTVISSTPEHYKKALPILCQQIGGTDGAELLGLHLEGPCLNPLQAKAHSNACLRPCSDFVTPLACYGSMEGVRIVTLAPEVAGADKWIPSLVRQGIVVSAGHTMATCGEMEKGVEAGVSMATHLFNAMGPFHHREPGVIGTILNRPEVYFSLIADGVHLHPMAVALAWHCQPQSIVLVSDGMSGMGLGDSSAKLAGRRVGIEKGKAVIEGTSTLAGSVVGMDQLLRNYLDFTKASLVEALEAASWRPAKLLGIEKRKGTLSVGADADLVILDEHLQLSACYAKGQKIR